MSEENARARLLALLAGNGFALGEAMNLFPGMWASVPSAPSDARAIIQFVLVLYFLGPALGAFSAYAGLWRNSLRRSLEVCSLLFLVISLLMYIVIFTGMFSTATAKFIQGGS